MLLVSFLLAQPVMAADIGLDEARDAAGQCAVCHGIDGIAKRPDVPNIGGESDFYLTKQLKAFRSGERRHHEMSIIAEGLTDEDIEQVVTWFSAITVSVQVPE